MNAAMAVDANLSRDPVSNTLKWILLITATLCFAVLIWGTYKTYELAPPFPDTFVTPSGETLMTKEDIFAGKAGFQRADLMDYGSLYGMGSYFGPDYTAKYLVELGRLTEENMAQENFGKPFADLSEGDQYVTRKNMQRALKGLDLNSSKVTLPAALAKAVMGMQTTIAAALLKDDFAAGWTRARSLDSKSAVQVADFLIYSSFTTIARRPGKNYSYTNNWPFEPTMGNAPTPGTFFWTWASFAFVFFGFGAVLFIYHRYLSGPDAAPPTPVFAGFSPLTASQRKAGQYFMIVALVLLAQIGAGAVMAHYYTERTGFYGIKIDTFLPFNFLRDVHTQTPIVWIGIAWISSGIFLSTIISGQEARGQGMLVDLLFWVTLFIVAGALTGDYLGIMNLVGNKYWFWIGNQGLSYIQLGRLWQIGFCIGLFLWSFIVFRGMWPTWSSLKKATREFWTGNIRLEHLFWASTINVAVLYCFGMIPLTGIEKSFTITDFWRWWVVHLWVEQSFEFFAACATTYLLLGTGLVSRRLAERTVYFETILVFLGGVIGTGHHWYWVGETDIWVPLGTMFSFIEVLPLVLLVIDAIEHRELIKRRQTPFPYKLAYLYIIGAAFWNFVGAGVFGGGTLNAPLVNYYEHATFLTLNHAHTALFGAFGLLALGLIYFCLRYAAGSSGQWSDRPGTWAFWLYNVGLVMWIVLNFFPIGWPQLMDVYEHGLAHARSLEFYNTTIFWQWMRLPGDVVFAAGALVMAWDFIVKLKPFFPRLSGKRVSPA